MTAKLQRQPATIGRLATAAGVVEVGRQAFEQGRAFWRNHMTYTVSVSEDDRIYHDVHEWLLEVMPDRKHRALVASSGPGHFEESISEGPGENQPTRLRLTYSDRQPQNVTIDGHRVLVSVDTAEASESKRREPKRIEFRSYSQAGQRAVLGHIERIHKVRTSVKPVLRIVNQWGSWSQRSDLPLRDLQSVILPEDQLDRIVTDLREFLAAEDRYTRLALPWHRGYMFHGPPGTGKTSLVKALANEFHLDLWYISLSDLKEEGNLMGLLSEVRPRSVLLLEDIDTVQITHNRNTEQGKISLSSLLNALDGVATPHGLITMMTTNHFDRLDPALTRAGRMDRIEELAHPGHSEMRRLYRHFYGRDLAGDIGPESISQAQASELFKRHLDQPDLAAQALIDITRATTGATA